MVAENSSQIIIIIIILYIYIYVCNSNNPDKGFFGFFYTLDLVLLQSPQVHMICTKLLLRRHTNVFLDALLTVCCFVFFLPQRCLAAVCHSAFQSWAWGIPNVTECTAFNTLSTQDQKTLHERERKKSRLYEK